MYWFELARWTGSDFDNKVCSMDSILWTTWKSSFMLQWKSTILALSNLNHSRYFIFRLRISQRINLHSSNRSIFLQYLIDAKYLIQVYWKSNSDKLLLIIIEAIAKTLSLKVPNSYCLKGDKLNSGWTIFQFTCCFPTEYVPERSSSKHILFQRERENLFLQHKIYIRHLIILFVVFFLLVTNNDLSNRNSPWKRYRPVDNICFS